ncbi:MAG TPA: UvrB/UvrC motif-containing protein, partial [Saprospiraceae bacterium]|nr:UvrB/UvrC motif-containing protein [Saprospiraceae bacterium]
LREGLDLPEVSLVAILDADKEGFLRNARSLTQTAGRAARNAHGLVIFYADKITDAMRNTIDETNRRRSIQMAYNEEHGITPTTVTKTREQIMSQRSILDIRGGTEPTQFYVEPEQASLAAEPIVAYASRSQLEKMIAETESRMKKAAKDLDFITAAQLRDEMLALKKRLGERFDV